MPFKYLFVFDIETVPDTSVVTNLVGDIGSENIEDLRTALTDYHLEITEGKNPFLRQPFHKIVAISYALINIECYDSFEDYSIKFLRSGGNENSEEQDLVAGFFSVIEKYNPRIVSFNGRTFDIPVLKYRAMKYGISAKVFYESGDRFANYNYRYSLDWHCDLIDALSDFGASARVKLNEVCSVFGFPGKFGTDGSEVSALYDSNNIKAIRNYCETDVLNTYLVYLRYMLHLGKTTIDGYNNSIQDILNFIENNKDKTHLQEFKQAWSISSNNKFKL